MRYFLSILVTVLFIAIPSDLLAYSIRIGRVTGPTEVTPGTTATYTWRLAGQRDDTDLQETLTWSVYDDRPIFDRLLIDEKEFSSCGLDVPCDFDISGTFQLTATNDLLLFGEDGKTDPTSARDPAHIFVLFERTIGEDVFQTRPLSVVVKAVPEPTSFLLVMIAGTGLILLRRRKVAPT